MARKLDAGYSVPYATRGVSEVKWPARSALTLRVDISNGGWQVPVPAKGVTCGSPRPSFLRACHPIH